MKSPAARFLLAALFGATLLLGAHLSQDAAEPPLVLTAERHHLGDDALPEWTETTPDPEGTRLDLVFEAAANGGEWVLEIDQRDVHQAWWKLALNGREIGLLDVRVERGVRWYPVPAGAVQDGRNELSIVPAEPTDDVVIGPVTLHRQSFRELFQLRPARVRVRDTDGAPLPARITLVDASGTLAPIHYAERATTAVRTGIAYTSTGELAFEVPVGRFRVFASRGFEWSRAAGDLIVGDTGAVEPVELALERQVDTSGWIAVDTHIHTLTFSGHGDSSVEERMVTLAAEGVELAVSTDHNHNTDYRPYQEQMELTPWFTPVVGNEVTTDNGHMNAFPLDPADEVPDHSLTDWPALVEEIRAHGAQVVILNHPRWPKPDDCPLSDCDYEPLSGEREGGAFTFDAVELVNSTLDEPDAYRVLRDWFGILNRGEVVFGVGSSDSHTVGDPVGQGRTYVAAADTDPAAIDVDAACRALREGRASVSMGLFIDAHVGEHGMGATARVPREGTAVLVRVAAPHWARPRELRVFLNGTEVAAVEIEETDAAGPTDRTLRVELPRLQTDSHLVCAVLGDAVDEPFWHSLNPYVFAVTNPIFLDIDGDGWESPRDRAGELWADMHLRPMDAPRDFDEAVLIQLLAMARGAFEPPAYQRFAESMFALGEANGWRLRDYVEATADRPR